MHQCNVGVPSGRITTDIAGPYLGSKRRDQYLLTAVDYFTKLPEVNTIPNQEASTMVDALKTNFCHFGVLRQLQGWNFEF
jgi:hypothetical protein